MQTENHHAHTVKHWFAGQYQHLHPTLQQFHAIGGTLAGQATITYGKGIARRIAKRIAQKMQIPPPGSHHLRIDIEPTANSLIWNRTFNHTTTIQSHFIPISTIHNGYWLEHIGNIKMHLTVQIKNGGWHWQPLRLKYRSIFIPLWIAPRSTAYKVIEQDQYKFHVSFALPLRGTILSYSGLLTQIN